LVRIGITEVQFYAVWQYFVESGAVSNYFGEEVVTLSETLINQMPVRFSYVKEVLLSLNDELSSIGKGVLMAAI
jgi:hypothetical protein